MLHGLCLLRIGGKREVKAGCETGIKKEVVFCLTAAGNGIMTYHKAFGTADYSKNKQYMNCVYVNRRNENLKTFNKVKVNLS